jgi:colanic acid biosynthesis glycosyl transferase WcaI
MSPLDSRLRTQWAADADFVIGYSGNLGRVHEFDTLLDAAALLRDRSGIRFVVSGRGPRLEEVRSHVRAQGLSNVAFEPLQDRMALSDALGAADAHVVILRPPYEGLVQPSKLYGVMAAGRPTIFVGDVTGETAAILAEAGAGVSIRTGDAAGMAAAIMKLRDDASEGKRLGTNARKAFDEKYDMPIAFSKWESILKGLAIIPHVR